MRQETNEPELNLWTIGSIAVVAYCLANILHEALGHGGACLLLGVRPKVLNAIFLEWDSSSVPDLARRIIAAGGGFVNLLTGVAALAMLRWARPRADSLRYFLWLFGAISLLMAFGYVLFSGVFWVGDWRMVFRGLAPQAVVRIGLTLIGAALYFAATPRLILPLFLDFLGTTTARESQIRRLLRFPYIVGGMTFIAAGLLNPYGAKLLMLSGVSASLGGTSLLAWCKISPAATPSGAGTVAPLVLRFNPGWIAAGIVMLIVFVGILGPGIVFQR
jgi:hypothetical protein